MMRIGVLGDGFLNWGGGIDFLRVVTSSLLHSSETLELHVLVPSRGPRLTALSAARRAYRDAKALLGRGSVAPQRVEIRHLVELAGSAERGIALHEIDIGNSAIVKAARTLSLDVLIPAITPLPSGFPVPWVGYIYDFQHRYFPQLFSPAECAQRDKQFSAMLESARAVIVNARTVAADIARFHPEARARIFALPFSAAPQAAWLVPCESPASKYGIEKPYFIVCNQFWTHKDHATAFAAFAQIAATHPDVDLVCTGTTSDYRDPEHFPALRHALARDGISHRVHILGMVPKADQIALVKGAIALIQPTLFEGGPGGGAVYDAVSLGVRCVVSDIAVNLELSEPGISFFPAGDVSALATLLSVAIGHPCALDRDADMLRQRGQARRAACGAQVLAAIRHARDRR